MTTPGTPDPTRDAFNDMVKGFIEDASYGEPAEARLFAEAMAALDALITAARAEGATAERARLAGLASEEDREMVERIMPACPKRWLHERWKHSTNAELALAAKMCTPDYPCGDCVLADAARTTLRARLAAARGEAIEEAARVCDDAVVECRRAAQRAQEQGNSELMCSREDKADCAEALARRIRALCPPPDAEVGRG